MTTVDPNRDFARRAVACWGWRWVEGMVLKTTGAGGLPNHPAGTSVRLDGNQLMDLISECMVGCDCEERCSESECYFNKDRTGFVYEPCRAFDLPKPLPDFDDLATRHLLLPLVREAWGDPGLYVECTGLLWRVTAPLADPISSGATELEALIVALEAASRMT